MRRFLIGIIFGLALGVSSQANAQCLLCGVIGFALGSASQSGAEAKEESATKNILYIMPHANERVQEPAALHLAHDHCYYTVEGKHWYSDSTSESTNGWTIQKRFERMFGPEAQPSRYEIVQVIQMPQRGDPTCMILWFAYIEKDKLKPLTQ